MTAKTKTPLAIAVEHGLQYLAATWREPVEILRARYRSNRQFRRMVNAKAKQALKLPQRKRDAVKYALQEFARSLSPANADALLDVLRNDYHHDPQFRSLIDGFADAILQGALQTIAVGKVPRPEGEPAQ